MDPLLQMRALRWLISCELERGDLSVATLSEGEDILKDLEDFIEMEEADLAIIAQMHGDDTATHSYDDVMLARATQKRPPVIEGKLEDLEDQDLTCKKCGVEMAVSAPRGTTPMPICPMCRLSPEDQRAVLEKLEKE